MSNPASYGTPRPAPQPRTELEMLAEDVEWIHDALSPNPRRQQRAIHQWLAANGTMIALDQLRQEMRSAIDTPHHPLRSVVRVALGMSLISPADSANQPPTTLPPWQQWK